MDQAWCSAYTFTTTKWENNTCYLLDPPTGAWVAVGVEYPGFDCEHSGLSATYSDGDGVCTVSYNGTYTRWKWMGAGWQQTQ